MLNMKYKSEIYEIIHQSAIDKFAIGAIPEARMREYDEMCLVSETDASAEYKTTQKITNSGDLRHIDLVTA